MILVLNCGSQSIKWKVFDQKLKLVKAGAGIALEDELEKVKNFKPELADAQWECFGSLISDEEAKLYTKQ